MLESHALQHVVEFDVHSEIVRIQFEFVSRLQSGIFVDVHRHRRHASINAHSPMAPRLRRNVKCHEPSLFYVQHELCALPFRYEFRCAAVACTARKSASRLSPTLRPEVSTAISASLYIGSR